MEPRRARDQLPTGHAFVYFKDWKVDCGDGVWYGFESEEVTVSIRRLRMYIYSIRTVHIYVCKYLVKASDQWRSDDFPHVVCFGTLGTVQSLAAVDSRNIPATTKKHPCGRSKPTLDILWNFPIEQLLLFVHYPASDMWSLWSIRKGTPSSKASSLGSFVHFQQSTSWLPTSTCLQWLNCQIFPNG